MKMNKKSESHGLDFHGFSRMSISFILKYMFTFEKEYLLKDDKGLIIVCGKGKHTRKDKEGGQLIRSVREELGSWDPPIETCLDKDNKGVVLVKREEIVKFLECRGGNNLLSL